MSKPLRPDDDICTCKAKKKKKKDKNDDEEDEPKDGHLVSSCLVVLAVVGYVDGKCIPIAINPFRNSHLGIKPLRNKFEFENDETNKQEGERLQDEMKYAAENPYIFESKNLNIQIKIEYQGFVTMV